MNDTKTKIAEIKRFIEDEIPEAVRRFPEGEKFVKKYFLHLFTKDGFQGQNLAEMPSVFEVITYPKDSCLWLLKSGEYKDRYKDYSVKIDPKNPIKFHTSKHLIEAIVHAYLYIGGKPSPIIYELRKEQKRWLIRATHEPSITCDHLAYTGDFQQKVYRPGDDSFNVVQRLIRFRYLFERLDLGRCFWEKVGDEGPRSKIESIAEGLVITYLSDCAAWDDITPKPRVGQGDPDLVLRIGSKRIAVEVKTDNFTSLVASLKRKKKLDQRTLRQLLRFCRGNSINETFLVLFYNGLKTKNIRDSYWLPIDESNRVFIITLDYGRLRKAESSLQKVRYGP